MLKAAFIITFSVHLELVGREIDRLLNNTNLAGETTAEMIERGEKTCLECAARMGGIPVVTTGLQDALDACRLSTERMALTRHMKPEWMEN